jgi:hypothetical protein
MEVSTLTHSLSTVQDIVEGAVIALRGREVVLFGENRDSPAALRLALIRTELQRIVSGRPVRLGVLERAVQPSPANSPEGAESDLATDPETVGVRGA